MEGFFAFIKPCGRGANGRKIKSLPFSSQPEHKRLAPVGGDCFEAEAAVHPGTGDGAGNAKCLLVAAAAQPTHQPWVRDAAQRVNEEADYQLSLHLLPQGFGRVLDPAHHVRHQHVVPADKPGRLSQDAALPVAGADLGFKRVVFSPSE